MLATVGSALQSDSGIYAYSAWVPDFIPVTELARIYIWSDGRPNVKGVYIPYYRIDSPTSIYIEYGPYDAMHQYNRSIACMAITGLAQVIPVNDWQYDEEGSATNVTGYAVVQQGYQQKSNTRADGGVDKQAVNGTYPENGMHTDGAWYVRGARIS